MKKIISLVFLVLFSFALLLSGCGESEEADPRSFTTLFPNNFRIVVRVNDEDDFNEYTFAVSNGVYYYKSQEYTEDFVATTSTMDQYVGIKSGSDFVCYEYSETLGWGSSPVGFASCWAYLNTYCCIYPDFVFTDSQKQPDSTVNGTLCYTFNVNGIIYKISQDQYQIEWAFYTEPGHSYVSKFEVQSFSTTNCLSGVPTNNLPSA